MQSVFSQTAKGKGPGFAGLLTMSRSVLRRLKPSESALRARIGRIGVVIGAVALAAGCGGGGGDAADVTVLTNFTLIDGQGGAPVAGSALIIEDGRVAWVGSEADLDAPARAEVVNLDGKYVMPGLIDLHVHLGNVQDMVQDGAYYTRQSLEEELATHASYGVTTVLSMGTDNSQVFDLRRDQRQGRPEVARVYTAGQGLVFAGGYGGLAGLNQPVATPEEAAAAVAVQAEQGVDVIKFWLDDELGSMPKMPPAMTQAIIDAAHENDLRVLAHIFYLEDAQRLVDQGIDGLAHSVRDRLVDQRLIDSMKARGVWQMAETLSREASMFVYGERAPFLDDPFFTRGVSERSLEILSDPQHQASVAAHPHFHDYPEFLETAQRNLATLANAGVNYAFGTDAGPPGRFAGFFAHWELELMVEAGFTPAQAIATATARAAEFLQVDDLGVIRPGAWADLVVLDANPIDDIRNTRTIHQVYLAGRNVRTVNDGE